MVLRSLSYGRCSGTVRSDRGTASHQASVRSRGLCGADWRAGCGVVSHNPTVLQLDNPAPVRSVSLRVRDLDDRRASVIQPLEKLHDLFALRGMQISSRLVGEDQLRAKYHRARHAHKLLLAARQLGGKQVLLAHAVASVERVATQADALFVRQL